MRRGIAGRTFATDAAGKGRMFGVEEIDRRIGPIGQDKEFDRRIDETDVEGSQAGAYPDDGVVDPNNPRTWSMTQRNAPCPCGSGRKYKHCHGALK